MTIVVCGDGICPYVPCTKFPKCMHIKDLKGGS